MSTTTSALPAALPASYPIKQTPPFEFPKRKRWADLLLTEMFDDVAFVLSEDSKILFCGLSITEILGWKDVDLIDLDFFDLVDPVDHTVFRAAFAETLRTKEEYTIPIMLKSSPSNQVNTSGSVSKDTVFDVKLYPHTFGEGDEGRTTCVFAMTSPSPIRDMAMLATIMDLNTENLILQQKVAASRERLPADHPTSPQTPPAQSSSMYVTSSLNPTTAKNLSATSAQQQRGEHLSVYQTKAAESKTLPASEVGDDKNSVSAYSHNAGDDQSEDGTKRKKYANARYMTTGETRAGGRAA
ncbi:hypothetical protein D9619_005476 [Psilocybe cf. subviscida]|uniref:PAS domain-containing protein n=1 Tax=Psilocybe cf. subviscida TaxID=2480587 RepID=A0A8H5BXJ0_9AGAR|nr:hypothetical protein D9619_005476 [Psilocybe cf. subviscida]